MNGYYGPGRPRFEPYTLGKVTVRPLRTNPSLMTARGYYRDANDVRHEVTVSAATAEEAIYLLRRKVAKAGAGKIAHEYVGDNAKLRSLEHLAKENAKLARRVRALDRAISRVMGESA